MTTVQQFTPRALDNLKAGSIADPITPGLTIEALEGVKTWRFKRKVKGTNTVFKKVLGNFPKVSIADARTQGRAFNEMVENGVDPRADIKAKAQAGLTVADAHKLYMAYVRAAERKVLKPRTIDEKDRMFRLIAKIHTSAVSNITADDLWSIVEEKAETATTRANRLAAELKVFFGWCASRRGVKAGLKLASDPSRTLSGSWYAQSHKTRFLSDAEIVLFLRAIAKEKRVHQRALALMLLTAARRNEIVEAPRQEYADGVWTISGDRTKNWMTHRIPLAPWGQSLMEGAGDWLLMSPRKGKDGTVGPLSNGWPKVFARVRETMEELGGVPVAHFTPHDLRRTFRSNTVRLKIPTEIAELCLNHKKTGLVEIYDGYEAFDEKQEAFAKWEARLVEIATKAGVADALGMPSPQGA